jgi:CheY-like chemotaxis protein
MKKILIVDDDNGGGISFLIEDLKHYGFDAAFINDAGKVTDLLKKDEIHAIILDIMMPIPEYWSLELKEKCKKGLETGIVLYTIIREEYPFLPILFHTIKTANFIKNNRFTYTITKPEFPTVIIEKLNELISMRTE